jgi:RNA polymerase sigma-70 factor (ECF subfamily)
MTGVQSVHSNVVALCFAICRVLPNRPVNQIGTLAVATVVLHGWGKSVEMEADRPVREHLLDADAVDAAFLADALRDRTAFAPLYRRYVDAVYGYCRRRLDEPDAEDAASHIFTQALSKLDTCRGPSFRAWLFTIAHNVVIDRQRSRRPSLVLDETQGNASGERSPEDHALDTDRRQRLELAIRALPPDQRAAVELRLAGLTGVECAQALGKSPEATRMLQHRAFGTLRTALADLSSEERS